MRDQYRPAFDLKERSDRAVREAGFLVNFSAEAIEQTSHSSMPQSARELPFRDLRTLLWSSIDNQSSLDLDQIEVAEQLPGDVIRIYVGIADVDCLTPAGSPVDLHAAHNRCSVYTGADIYPMLPEAFSTDQTSLKPAADRPAIVVSMDVQPSGDVAGVELFVALTHNHAKLSYEEVGSWLEGDGSLPDAAVAVPGIEQQLRMQAEAAERLRMKRCENGALDFETVEAQPVVENGQVVSLHVPHKNRARSLIENLMVTANSSIAAYLEQRGIPSLQRVVRSPERWNRIVSLAERYNWTLPAEPDPVALSRFLTARRQQDPDRFPDLSLSIVKLLGPGEYDVVSSPSEHVGHFGLAVQSYTHSTAPNRRYADLVIQRLIKAALAQTSSPYTPEELQQIGHSCTERENAARKVERFVRKASAALLMQRHLGDVFEAIVTGASPKGTYVRLLSPPVEGRVTCGVPGLDVGDRARVRLLTADPERGHIDFECLAELSHGPMGDRRN